MKPVKRKGKVSTLVGVTSAVVLALSVVLGYHFLRVRAPAPVQGLVAAEKEAGNQPPRFLHSIIGPVASPLSQPLAVAVDDDGLVYVSDTSNNRIQVFTEDGRWVRKWGAHGKGPGQFDFPYGIAVRDGKVYVADKNNYRIQIFLPDGRFVGMIPPAPRPDARGFIPLNMNVGADGNLYVTSLDHRILVFDKKDSLIKEFGRGGSGKGELAYPNGVAVDETGRIWVADSGNARIQVFSPDAGQVVMTIGGEFVVPRGIVIRGERVWVADPIQQKIRVYDLRGKVRVEFGERGLGDGQLNFPNSLAFDRQGRLYVADRGSNRIAVFGYERQQ